MKYIQVGDIKSTDIGLRIIGYSRPSYAETRDVYTGTDGREGSKHHSLPDGMYNFSVTFRCGFKTEKERIEKLEEITDFLYTKEEVKIIQSDLPDRYRLGKVVDSVDYTPSYNILQVTVEFKTQPYSYYYTESTVEEVFDNSSKNHSQTISDIGTAFSEFELEVKLGSAVSRLDLQVGSVVLEINREILKDELLRINTDDFTVDKLVVSDGQIVSKESLVLDVDGEFPVLDRRNNEISLVSDEPFKCETSFKYTKRFLL